MLIRGGVVYDGLGNAPRRADVRADGDRIAAIGALKPEPGERVIDAGGLAVGPGFIDAHSHGDGGVEQNPDADAHVRQGITTAVVGQDGGHRFPLKASFDALDSLRPGMNYASFVGHGTIRSQVLGSDYKRAATDAEIRRMRALVSTEMRAGALGLSSGLEYDPGLYAETREVIALAEVAGIHGGLYISHVRDEENEALTSFSELIEIARKANVAAQVSHIKLGSSPVWGKARQALKLLENARKSGLDITADVYPYTFWQSSIIVIIPTRDLKNRALWEQGLKEIGGPANVFLSDYTPNPDWRGKTIEQIARQTNRSALEVIFEIVEKTHGDGATGRESVVVTAMQERDVATFVADPHTMFCTDGGLRGGHPRGAGAFPRILGRHVRERGDVSLTEAVRKLTSLPAKRFGLTDRGVLAPGKFADLTLFDPKTVKDNATIQNPTATPDGIPYVLVNGKLALDNGNITHARSGRALRRF